ncbi:MAG: ABC transporter permease, partial [Halofilum sp. (in: g-proteobacteria)]
MIVAIARREAGALFRSPVAWSLLAAVAALVAFIFLLHLESYLQIQSQLSSEGGPGVTGYLLPRLFGGAATIHLLALPLLTMGLIAGEWRH